MNKEIMTYLLNKPHSHLLTWCYIFSRLDEKKKASIFSYEILSRFNISKSTLQRIVSSSRVKDELGLTCKWVSNSLIVNPVAETSDLTTNSKRDKKELSVKKENKIIKRKEPNTLYSKMVDMYDSFCEEKTGVGCKIDGMQGKAMKSIISYLKKQCIKKNKELNEEQLNDNVLLSWTYVLTNWDRLDDYNRGRLRLNEINSSMLNILSKLKEQPINKKQKQRYEQISKAVRGAEQTDYSKMGKR